MIRIASSERFSSNSAESEGETYRQKKRFFDAGDDLGCLGNAPDAGCSQKTPFLRIEFRNAFLRHGRQKNEVSSSKTVPTHVGGSRDYPVRQRAISASLPGDRC